VVFILYKFWNIKEKELPTIKSSEEQLNIYMFGKKKEEPLNNTHYANKYCQILGINATVFIRRVGCILAFIEKLDFVKNEIVRCLAL
jgi:hypothetical protein